MNSFLCVAAAVAAVGILVCKWLDRLSGMGIFLGMLVCFSVLAFVNVSSVGIRVALAAAVAAGAWIVISSLRQNVNDELFSFEKNTNEDQGDIQNDLSIDLLDACAERENERFNNGWKVHIERCGQILERFHDKPNLLSFARQRKCGGLIFQGPEKSRISILVESRPTSRSLPLLTRLRRPDEGSDLVTLMTIGEVVGPIDFATMISLLQGAVNILLHGGAGYLYVFAAKQDSTILEAAGLMRTKSGTNHKDEVLFLGISPRLYLSEMDDQDE